MLSLHQEKIYSYFFQMSRLLFFMNESVSAEFFFEQDSIRIVWMHVCV